MLLLLLPCIPSCGSTVSPQHVLHFVCTIRLCIFLVDGMVPGKVSIRTLRLEADRFGGPLRRGLPVRSYCWGCCKSRTYRAERSTLDLLHSVSYGLEGRRRIYAIGFHALNHLTHAHSKSSKPSWYRMTSFGSGHIIH